MSRPHCPTSRMTPRGPRRSLEGHAPPPPFPPLLPVHSGALTVEFVLRCGPCATRSCDVPRSPAVMLELTRALLWRVCGNPGVFWLCMAQVLQACGRDCGGQTAVVTVMGLPHSVGTGRQWCSLWCVRITHLALHCNRRELYTDWYHFDASDNEYFFFLAFGHYTVSATALQAYLPACWMPVAVHS